MKSFSLKAGILKERVFFLALIASAAWHIFWLSAVTVVVAPKETAVVKFSNISFLGPLLARGTLEVRIEPPQRSFLEGRRLDFVEKMPIEMTRDIAGSAQGGFPVKDLPVSTDEKLTNFVKKAVGGLKKEAAYDVE